MTRAVILLALAPLLANAATQVQHGEELFFESGKGCGACHALKGKGTAVGPDLKIIGRLSPRAIAMAVHSTLTQYVLKVKLKSGGDAFPAMPGAKDDKSVTFYDLSKNPPELRKVDPADIASSVNNDSWKHPPVVNAYSDQDLADIIAYIRYAVTGSRAAVDPSEAK
jgi:mono/diheme cytochrome c family protein